MRNYILAALLLSVSVALSADVYVFPKTSSDTLQSVTARGATTTEAVTIGSRRVGAVGMSSLANGESVVASESYSHAEGGNTTASGYASHAEGMDTTASGTGSHAEGGNTTASGPYSHAEGMDTTASGHFSHAEGDNTTASGHFSHAEGMDTTASGPGSHAEGFGTTASGNYSHAEGGGTTASGDYSHTEGGGTTASGDYSHTEGGGTTASGNYSHAEGFGTTASGSASHASGYNSVASNTTAFAWQGAASDQLAEPEYGSHGNGTFNINPVGGLAGLWIGEENMATTLSAYATAGAVAAVQAEVVDPWIDWSAAIKPVNGTATVTRATGADPVLVLTDDVVISVPTDNWPTTGVARVSLSLWAGSHSVTLLTNTVDYASTPSVSTNDWTTILFRRTGDQAKWQGVGL